MNGIADAVLIGGGIFGQFAALTLAEHGRRVVLIDGATLWSEASSVNAGSLGVQNKLPELVPYTRWSWELWARMADRLGADVGVSRGGGYKVAMTDDEAARLDDTAAKQRALGLDVHMLDRAELRARAPWLSHEVVAATFSPEDGYASPTLVGPALRAAILRAGVRVVEHAKVASIRRQDALVVETDQGAFWSKSLGITAGACSGRLAAMLGAHLPIALDVNMVAVTESAPPTIGNMTSHARGILTLKQVANRSCLIGGGWQGIGTLDDRRKEVDYDQLVHNLRLAVRVVPGLAKLNVLRSWAGYEGVTPDSLPYLGRLGDDPDIYVAACARGGFTLGPIVGQLLGELIATGETSRPIDSFNPRRFPYAEDETD
ncbi:NAD(P)/FAD-dependent oxidoreductase [Burkholderia multivorans]|uniref:NAD(P)/FAD-dependent oxidoreductase n=1 Tax=Burkholderia multivorans TaxID=87883 RepID=UPI0020195042|nr:FAD-dependent oxidoreductase [Burkholderia multivorans]MCO1368527.1 FAD-binding oxidoreductase [Burkholderia multivorans]MCO1380418.1 FAD-binding oxidoreductase [Burkholderia multivorans]UQP21471.1 FAD-binding oxidoreductase [Burkholderia multivorans]UQP92082.1 FAD-binding oxidoreductase [Burkholderia multivorans]